MTTTNIAPLEVSPEGIGVTAASAKNDLIALRDRYLRELADMATNRPAALQKLEDIYNLERAISVVEPVQANPLRYGGFKRAISAILDLLDERNSAIDQDELVRVLLERGFRAPNPAARSIILKSIGAYLHGEAGRKKQVIKKVGSKIGRGEWPDERFI